MKVRYGFVSNSSSSSFIVGFEKTPESEAELLDMLYPADKYGHRVGPDAYGECLDAEAAAKIVWEQLQGQKPINKEEVLDFLEGGDFLAASQYLDSIWPQFVDLILYKLHFSDDTEIGGIMEHGDTFVRLPHITISNH